MIGISEKWRDLQLRVSSECWVTRPAERLWRQCYRITGLRKIPAVKRQVNHVLDFVLLAPRKHARTESHEAQTRTKLDLLKQIVSLNINLCRV